MLEYDKCLSHRRNASTSHLHNPMQKAASQIDHVDSSAEGLPESSVYKYIRRDFLAFIGF